MSRDEGLSSLTRFARSSTNPSLAAYLGGVSETRAVRQWAEGERAPGEQTQQRLRVAAQVALTLNRSDGA